jgi:hypothetical protein
MKSNSRDLHQAFDFIGLMCLCEINRSFDLATAVTIVTVELELSSGLNTYAYATLY